MENIFIDMIIELGDKLRSGEIHKGRFIGIYTQKLNSIDKENSFRYKRPQFIGDKTDKENNWLDYILSIPNDEYESFMLSLNKR